ncbi:MAG: hypothetical protein JWN57_2588, partial [Frankiales bacterium]|nr:hypothetical protein [Frankiales bacterium]
GTPLRLKARPVARRKVARPVLKPVVKPPGRPAAKPVAVPVAKPVAKPATTTVRKPTVSPVQAVAPATPGLLSDDPVLHLLRRATYGPTPELLAEVKALGVSAWLDQQLAPQGIDDSQVERWVSGYSLLTKTPAELRAELSGGSWTAMDQVCRAHLVRSVWSKRQLFEVMVDFWSNHFNIATPSSEVWDCKPLDDRTVIRPHALGRFADMLQASARSPAMLRYLDNADSRGSKPNENYGREILELHTVGLGAGYTESDMRQSALALTGLSVWNAWDKNVPAEQVGSFRYRADFRYRGALTVLGWSHPNASAADGEAAITSYLNHLARHPGTARRLATKLCLRFVSDTPPASLVDTLAAVYLAHDTAIVPVLRALFASAEFAASIGQKVRRPYEDVVATLRTLQVQPSDPAGPGKAISDVLWQIGQLGHGPLGWHPPNGYPDVAAAWASPASTLGRWNAHVGHAGGWWAKNGLPAPDLRARIDAPTVTTVGQLVDRLSRALLCQPMRPEHAAALVAFIGIPATAAPRKWDFDLLPILAALVLDSPYWSLR